MARETRDAAATRVWAEGDRIEEKKRERKKNPLRPAAPAVAAEEDFFVTPMTRVTLSLELNLLLAMTQNSVCACFKYFSGGALKSKDLMLKPFSSAKISRESTSSTPSVPSLVSTSIALFFSTDGAPRVADKAAGSAAGAKGGANANEEGEEGDSGKEDGKPRVNG